PWCRGASCATPPASCCDTWPAGARRRLPTEPAVLRGRLPLSLRTTREPHQVEPRTDRGAPGRAGPSRAALPLRPRRGDQRQRVDLRFRGGGAARPRPEGRAVHVAAPGLGAGAHRGGWRADRRGSLRRVDDLPPVRDRAPGRELLRGDHRHPLCRPRGAGAVMLVVTTRPPPPARRLGLVRRNQHDNAWVALAALNRLPPPFGPGGDTWPESFGRAYVPGRFDVRGKWIFDVAHNPDG